MLGPIIETKLYSVSVKTARPEKSCARALHPWVVVQAVMARPLKRGKILGEQGIRGGEKVDIKESGESAGKSRWGRATIVRFGLLVEVLSLEVLCHIKTVKAGNLWLVWMKSHLKARLACLTQDGIEAEAEAELPITLPLITILLHMWHWSAGVFGSFSNVMTSI